MADALILREFEVRSVGVRPLTINAVVDLHRMAWSKHTKAVRGEWKLLAKEARLPRLQRAGFTVVPLHANGRSPQDPAACAPDAKAAIDGLVDAGVLPDDGPAFVSWVRFVAPRICGVDGMLIRISEVA